MSHGPVISRFADREGAGKNHLELRVVNQWINRQIDGQNLPEDSGPQYEWQAQVLAKLVRRRQAKSDGTEQFHHLVVVQAG